MFIPDECEKQINVATYNIIQEMWSGKSMDGIDDDVH